MTLPGLGLYCHSLLPLRAIDLVEDKTAMVIFVRKGVKITLKFTDYVCCYLFATTNFSTQLNNDIHLEKQYFLFSFSFELVFIASR